MDIFCPHCFARIAVADDRAGQSLACTACGKTLTAPTLSPTGGMSTASRLPPSSMPGLEPAAEPALAKDHPASGNAAGQEAIYGLEPAASPVPTGSSSPTPVPAASKPAPAPSAPPAPRARKLAEVLPEPTRSLVIPLRRDVLPWIAALALALVFLMSFFTWYVTARSAQYSLWQLAFGADGVSGIYLAYLALTLGVGLPVAILSLLEDLGWLGEGLGATWNRWLPAVLAVALGLSWLLLLNELLHHLFRTEPIPLTLALFLSAKLHFLALVGAALDAWVRSRAHHGLGAPQLVFRC